MVTKKDKTKQKTIASPQIRRAGKSVSVDHPVTKQNEKTDAYLASFPELNVNPILELDRKGKILYQNPACKRLFPDLIELGPKHPFLTDWSKTVKKLLAGNLLRPFILETKVGDLYFEQACFAVAENRIRIYARNITRRKIAEQALQRSEQNFRNLMDNSPLGIRITGQNENALYTNKAFLDLYGYASVEEFNAIPFRKRYTPASYAGYLRWKAKRDCGEKLPEINEIRILRKDNTVRDVYAISKQTMWNGQICHQTIYIDNTERRQMEQALQLSEENFHNSIDSSSMGIVITDVKNRVFYANQAFLDIFGYKNVDEISSKPASEFYTPELKAESIIRAKKLAKGEPLPDKIEVEILQKDGTIRNFEVFHKEVIWNGKKQHQTIYNDITERQRLMTEINELNNIMQLVTDINQLIVIIDDEKTLLQKACDQFVKRRQYPLAWIGFIHEGSYDIVPFVKAGNKSDYISTIRTTWDNSRHGQGPTGMAVKTGKPSVMKDILNNTHYKPWKAAATKMGFKASLALPLTLGNKVIGVFNIYSTSEKAFDEKEMALLTELSGDLSLGIEKIRLRDEQHKMEQALREKEEKLMEAQEIAHLGYWYWDVKTGDVNWSDEVYEIFRLDPQIFKPKIDSILALSPWPEDHERDQELIKRATDSHQPGSYEQKFLRPDNSIGYYYSNFQGNYNTRGKLIAIIGTVLDITERKQAEEALRQERDRAQTYLDIAAVMIVALDNEGKVMLINRRGCEILGYEAEEIIGKHWLSNFIPDRLRIEVAEVADRLRAGEIEPVKQHENPVLTRDGRERIIAWNNTELHDENGKIIGTISSGEDITERKQAEQALKESEEKYRLIVENSRDVIFALNSDGEFIYLSPSIKSVLGYEPTDLIGLRFDSLVHPDDGESVRAGIQRNIKDGFQTKDGQQYRIRNTNGEWRWHVGRGNTVRDELGNFLYFIGTANDITERKHADEALKASEQNFRNTVDSSTMGIRIVDADWRTLYVNQVFLDIFGYANRDEVGPNPLQEHYTPEEHTRFLLRKEKRARGENVPDNIDVDIIRTDGNIRNLQVLLKKVFWDGKEQRQLIYNDVTERKRSEKALKESELNFRNSLDSSLMGIRIVDDEHKTLYANQEFLKIFGYKNIEEISDFPLQDHYTPAEHERFLLRKEQRLRGEPIADNLQVEITGKDGAIRYIETHESEVLWNGKKQCELIYKDVTESKLAQEALKLSEQNFRNSMDGSFMGIRIVDIEGHILYSNRAFLDMFGYKNIDEVAAHPPREMFTPESYKVFSARVEKIRHGEPVPDTIEVDIIRRDGAKRHLQLFYKDVFWDGNQRYQTLYYDVTEQKQTEEALKASEEKYSALIEQSTDGIVMLDSHTIEFANQRIYELTGYSQNEIMGKQFIELIALEYHELLINSYHRVVAPGEANTLELEIIAKDGKKIAVESRALPLEYKNRPATMVIIRNITARKKAEAALIASEQNFRNSMDSSLIGIRIVDKKWQTLYANQNFLEIFGYKTVDEIGIVNPKELYTPAEYERFMDRHNRRQKGETVSDDIEMEIVRKDGAIRYVQSTLNHVLWNGEEHYQLLCMDVTERRQAEQALKLSEQNFRNSMDSSPVGIRISDIDEKNLYANQALLDIFGYKNVDEIAKNPPQNFYAPQAYADWVMRHQRLLRGELMPKQIEINITRKDGAVRNLQVSLREIFWDGKQRFQTLYNDITELKQAEKAQHETEEKYRMIVENTRDMIFTIDLRREYVYVSPSFHTMLGYKQDELIGKPFISLVHPEDVPIIEKEVQLSNMPGYKNSGEAEYRIRNAAGEWRWIVSRGTRLADIDGKFLYFIGIARDITEQKQAEQEKRRLEERAQIASRLAAVGEMAAGIAHEINNPLTGVLGFAELIMEKENIPDDIKENLVMIADGSQRVANIVKRLLTFARQSKPVKTLANLNELIENTIKLREYVLKTNSINVVTIFDPELPWSVVDPGQLQQVFLNLIVNAEQAMKKAHGKGTLTITTEKLDNMLHISFQDDGPGIAKENMTHMFEPFFTTKAPGEGTGLGLSLSRSIVLEHDGKMSVESEVGKGATFVVELPMIEALPGEEETPAPASRIKPVVAHNARILVVDDEPTIRDLLEKVLTKMGFRVDLTADAGIALDKIHAGEIYDLIITDIRMPGMSGIELYSRIMEKAPEMKDRIVFITGDVMGVDIKTFLIQNKLPYLAKPFDIDLLKEKIGAMIEPQTENNKVES